MILEKSFMYLSCGRDVLVKGRANNQPIKHENNPRISLTRLMMMCL